MRLNFSTPDEICRSFVEISEKKGKNSFLNLAILGFMAGAYIAIAGQLATVVTVDATGYVGEGLTRVISGSVFSVGLMLVVLAGAELFTGNSLIVIGVLERRITPGSLLRNWAIVYCANFLGALLVVWIMYNTGLWKALNHLVGAKSVITASVKTSLNWQEAFFRGVMCNWLVGLAVWIAAGSRDIVSKIFGIFFPIMAFVASGFEHSIANMYFIPMGLILKDDPGVLAAAATLLAGGTMTAADVAERFSSLTWGAFVLKNLIPVTLGNIVGAGFFVGTLYWVVYLRHCAKRAGAGASTVTRSSEERKGAMEG